MKRLYLLLVSALLTSHFVKSQDIIVKSNNDTVFCKIIGVTDDKITYQVAENDGIATKSINTQFVNDFEVGERESVSRPARQTVEPTTKTSACFLTLGGGYSQQAGTNEKTGDSKTDDFNDDLIKGFALEAALVYFPSWKEKKSNWGLSLNLLYNNHSAKGTDMQFYDLGIANTIKVTNTRIYAGPAFALLHNFSKAKLGGLFGMGALHIEQEGYADLIGYQASTTVFGLYTAFEADYKIDSKQYVGIRLSSLFGYFKELKGDVITLTSDEPINAGSTNISLIYGFRLK